MEKLIDEVHPKHKFNYRLFQLHPDDKEDRKRFEKVTRRQVTDQTNDPYFRQPSFSPDERKVYPTA